jgi:catechol 2,3-dioxygenase
MEGRPPFVTQELEMETAQGPLVPTQRARDPIDAGIRIGHVHLRTADIERVRGFYVEVLGFDVIAEARDVPGWGTTGDIMFLSAGGYHHHLGFNTWKSRDGEPMPDGYTGLHHVAIAYPTRWGLADAYRRLAAIDWPIRQAESYPTHDAIYVIDPDGNTLELMWDKPASEWPLTPEGHQAMVFGQDLDLDELLTELDLA